VIKTKVKDLMKRESLGGYDRIFFSTGEEASYYYKVPRFRPFVLLISAV
jgi:hypothetical protein